ncbi:ArnT family glycosyltransferase [Streptomyces sp. NPDC093600]|uniref:ArnT family glycosyltransferase n=1 Tax=Streptomyces sp. NPDC093600 TaxID=3366047 RepID=UPI0037F715E4
MRDSGLMSGSPSGLPSGRSDEAGDVVGRRRGAPGGRALAHGMAGPAVVAAAFTVAQLVLAVPGVGLGWDETVYVSQVSDQAPAAFFSAPRARGITFLVAPVTAVTASTVALRVYLALLSGAGLFLALWAWRRLLPPAVLAVGGALFASLWVTLFYGPQVMPNLWVALASLAAVGCFLRGPGDRWALPGLGAGVAFVALMRPTDAVWLVLPLTGAALLTLWRRRRGWPLLLVPAAGAALGGVVWVVEAYTRYGGLGARLRRGSEIQGHLGWHMAVDDHLRALGGRTLCRPCDVPWAYPVASLWLLALPLLVAAGVLAAWRTRHRMEIVVATAAGASLAVPYLFTVDYAAPRFLLPAYALLMLPVALAVVRACRSETRWRPSVVILVAVALTAHLAVQYRLLDGVVDRVRRDTIAFADVARELRAEGVRPPCVVTGEEAIRVAFRAGCASRQPTGHDASITPAALASAALQRPVAVLLSGDRRPPAYARHWRVLDLPDLRARTGYRAYLSPTAIPEGPSSPRNGGGP